MRTQKTTERCDLCPTPTPQRKKTLMRYGKCMQSISVRAPYYSLSAGCRWPLNSSDFSYNIWTLQKSTGLLLTEIKTNAMSPIQEAVCVLRKCTFSLALKSELINSGLSTHRHTLITLHLHVLSLQKTTELRGHFWTLVFCFVFY